MALNISHHHDSVLVHNRSLLTLKILEGPGTGQTRMVTGWDASTRTLALEEALDGHFEPGRSVLAIVGSFGAKAVVGNRFNWTEVVQWYSNTLGGVMADNTLTDCNVLNGGNVGNAVGVRVACTNRLAQLDCCTCTPTHTSIGYHCHECIWANVRTCAYVCSLLLSASLTECWCVRSLLQRSGSCLVH